MAVDGWQNDVNESICLTDGDGQQSGGTHLSILVEYGEQVGNARENNTLGETGESQVHWRSYTGTEESGNHTNGSVFLVQGQIVRFVLL